MMSYTGFILGDWVDYGSTSGLKNERYFLVDSLINFIDHASASSFSAGSVDIASFLSAYPIASRHNDLTGWSRRHRLKV